MYCEVFLLLCGLLSLNLRDFLRIKKFYIQFGIGIKTQPANMVYKAVGGFLIRASLQAQIPIYLGKFRVMWWVFVTDEIENDTTPLLIGQDFYKFFSVDTIRSAAHIRLQRTGTKNTMEIPFYFTQNSHLQTIDVSPFNVKQGYRSPDKSM